MTGFEALLLVTLLLLLRLGLPLMVTLLFCRGINCFLDRYGAATRV